MAAVVFLALGFAGCKSKDKPCEDFLDDFCGKVASCGVMSKAQCEQAVSGSIGSLSDAECKEGIAELKGLSCSDLFGAALF